MSPVASAEGVTTQFFEELDQLRLQVDLMALRVSEAVDQAIAVLDHADADAAATLLSSDDQIDALHVSLTERCYELLVRHQPMASDLRLVVSVIRILGALERIGNLCLRIAKLLDDQPLLRAHPAVFQVISELADNVRSRFRAVHAAWSSDDLDELDALEAADPLDAFAVPLVERILDLDGDDAVRVAMAAFVAGRSLDRIGDHSSVIAARLRYLVTGDNAHLAQEVGS